MINTGGHDLGLTGGLALLEVQDSSLSPRLRQEPKGQKVPDTKVSLIVGMVRTYVIVLRGLVTCDNLWFII